MNRKKCALLVTALALPLTMGSAFAAEDFDKLEKVACSDLKYSSEFLAKYPTAPAACLEGRVHEGKRYGKFVAKVFLNSPDRTTVELLNVKGDPLTTFSFKPGRMRPSRSMARTRNSRISGRARKSPSGCPRIA